MNITFGAKIHNPHENNEQLEITLSLENKNSIPAGYVDISLGDEYLVTVKIDELILASTAIKQNIINNIQPTK
jgi:hypothetical protein